MYWCVRHKTPHDEEFKIIVFSPSFVLHYINEVLWLVSLGRLKYVHTAPYRSRFRTCGVPTHTLSTRGLGLLTQRFPTRIIRGSPAPFAFATLSRIRFSITLLTVFVNFKTLSTIIHRPSSYQQLVDSTDGLINSWLISKNPYQQSIDDKELIVDKVVLINKEPY